MSKVMRVLGVSYLYDSHDNSMVVVEDGKIVFAESEERLSRKKHDGAFPKLAIESFLDRQGLTMDDFDKIAVAFPPIDTSKMVASLFERSRLDPWLFGAYMGLRSPKIAMQLVKEKLGREKVASQLPALIHDTQKLVYVDHELAHAQSAYRTSGFEKALAIGLDALGSTLDGTVVSGKVCLCEGPKVTEVESVPHYASLATFYEAISVHLGFTLGDGAGKTMGFAAYGDPKAAYSALKAIAPDFIDDRWVMPKSWWIDYETLSRRAENAENFRSTRTGRYLAKLEGKVKREDIAAAAQLILEEVMVKWVSYLLKKYDQTQLCCAGGIFYNIKMNKQLMDLPGLEQLYVFPNAGDSGVAAGAALSVYYQLNPDRISGSCPSMGLGTEFSDEQIKSALEARKDQLVFERFEPVAPQAAQLLVDGYVLGWFQGRAEFGPRALGHRSVIADPRSAENRERINKNLKRRDWFMPFAPSMLEEEAPRYLKTVLKSPFMILYDEATEQGRKDIPAAIHVDGTLRPHTVSAEVNQPYWELLTEFKKLTGVGGVLNTSFNKHGLPIVHSPDDAIDHLVWNAIEILVIGNYVVRPLEKV
ncbi:MAG: carbamoyltransferase C-terminal domain-containing protein [bacterium]|nr:carbamoyltransferase C-terminal domain-containing protein [bacterium]